MYCDSVTDEEAIDVQIRPKVDGSFNFLEFDSQGQLHMNNQPSGNILYTHKITIL